jgi:hypothetical protein
MPVYQLAVEVPGDAIRKMLDYDSGDAAIEPGHLIETELGVVHVHSSTPTAGGGVLLEGWRVGRYLLTLEDGEPAEPDSFIEGFGDSGHGVGDTFLADGQRLRILAIDDTMQAGFDAKWTVEVLPG